MALDSDAAFRTASETLFFLDVDYLKIQSPAVTNVTADTALDSNTENFCTIHSQSQNVRVVPSRSDRNGS